MFLWKKKKKKKFFFFFFFFLIEQKTPYVEAKSNEHSPESYTVQP